MYAVYPYFVIISFFPPFSLCVGELCGKVSLSIATLTFLHKMQEEEEKKNIPANL